MSVLQNIILLSLPYLVYSQSCTNQQHSEAPCRPVETGSITASPAVECMEAFTKEGVVPDVIDTVPPACLKVTYGEVNLSPGGVLTPTMVKDKPLISYETEPDTYYCLIFHDPDAPSRADPKMGEIQHWLIVNIPGNDIRNGKEMTQYRGSGAPKGTGLHRYILLLYKQTKGLMDVSQLPVIDNKTVEGRRHHRVREFANKHGLELAAGNFFLAEYDDYVPILRQQVWDKPPSAP